MFSSSIRSWLYLHAGLATVTSVLVVAAATHAADAVFMQGCPPMPSNTTQWATLKVKGPNGCVAEDGGYVRINSSYNLHVAAVVTGSCQTQVWQSTSSLPPAGMCVNDRLYYRTIGTTYESVNNAFRGAVVPDPSNSPTLQYYSTEGPLNTLNAGSPWSPSSEGSFVYTSSTGTNQTLCVLQPATFSQDASVTLNALKCEPKFGRDTNLHYFNLLPQEPPGKIQIYLPGALAGAESALRAAVADWNAVLPPNLQFEVVSTLCGFGPACVNIAVKELPQSSLCAYTHAATDENGLISGNIELQLAPDWLSYSLEGRQRTFAHELIHLLGLTDFDTATCGVSDAVSQPNFSCRSESVMHSVTRNDWLPIRNSVYGDKTRATCGW